MASLSNEELARTVEAVREHGSASKASIHLGMDRRAVDRRMISARERNLLGEVSGRELQPGERIIGVSTRYDADREFAGEWVKTKRDPATEGAIDAITAAFDQYTGQAGKIPAPKTAGGDLLTIYNIADHHLGLYAWGDETGNDYDLDIGANLLRATVRQLIEMAPASHTAVILNLGDFFHSDNQDNQTARSGHSLDVDTRFSKVLQTGVALMVECIQMALTKHKRVIVRCLPGNHDDHTALALSVALAAFFSKEKRLDIDTDPGRFWFHQFGKVLLAATHGDKTKLADMPGIMAATRHEDWGRSQYRYAFSGHIHHQTRVEKHGAICETMPTLAAKDAYSAGHGYTSNRAMISITYHKDRGEYLRHTVNVATQ